MATSEVSREIVDFLLKSENIESAFDLVEVMPLAIDRLHIKFWETLKRNRCAGATRARGCRLDGEI